MRTDIEPPANLGDKDLIRFFPGWKWLQSPTGPTTLDFRRVNFIAPWAICLFAAYAKWLEVVKRKNVRVLIHPSSVAGYYLSRSGLPELLNQSLQSTASPTDDRIVPITQIARSDQIPTFVTKVMTLLQLNDDDLSGAVRYSLVELLRNVVQHSQSPIGGLAMAQFYPNTGLVEVVVADAGVGIRRTLRGAYPEIDNDLKALKFSTQPHVSGTFGPGAFYDMKENAGLGLFFIKQITSLAGGGFFLGSGRVLADIWGEADGTQKKIYKTSRNDGWPGTFAVLQLRRESIGDFEGVLSVCRRLSQEARKAPAALNLDFVEEIPELEELTLVRVRDFEENVEEAGRIRDEIVATALSSGRMAILDFSGISFATQSFVHALIYKVLRDFPQVASALSIANCTNSTREAILAVAGYASAARQDGKELL